MKFNQWTLGLAAVGAVSLASVVNAEEAKLSTLNTALSNTVISGYVDVAAQWNMGDQLHYSGGKADQFSLNDAVISLDKALDESPWASGYHVDLNVGKDALTAIGGSATSNAGIRQAYVTLRTPVGNGIDWKVGAMDGITGYEGNTSYQNPNYTRSYGYAINPASYVGLVGTYKINDIVSATSGILNRGTSQGYGQSAQRLSSKDYLASVALTAPKSLGFLSGSTLNLQTIQSFDNYGVNNYSINGTFNTPLAAVKVGLAYDVLQSLVGSWDGNIYGAYVTYQATDKLNLSLRAEYVDSTDLAIAYLGKGEEVTATLQYDLWANVVSRAEFRWDHVEHGTTFATSTAGMNENAYLAALNIVYKF